MSVVVASPRRRSGSHKKGVMGMKTVKFNCHNKTFSPAYVCSEPGDQSGDYVKIKREYQKHEFCSDIECLSFAFGACQSAECIFSAKDFHHWLKKNGFKIVKGE